MCLRLWRRILHDRSNEAIPSSRERLNEDGRPGRFAERITQPFDSGIQTVIEVDEGVCRPELAAQFLSGNHFPRSFKQRCQDLQRLFLQLYLLSPVPQFPGVKIDLERTETDNSG
jgi:hypothetical protein